VKTAVGVEPEEKKYKSANPDELTFQVFVKIRYGLRGTGRAKKAKNEGTSGKKGAPDS